MDPKDWRPRKAGEVVAALFDHVRPVLTEYEDEQRANALLDCVLSAGTGAQRQRESYKASGQYSLVVAAAIARIHLVG